MENLIIVVFIIGYLAIALEHPIKINKAATALITGVLCWALFAWQPPNAQFEQTPGYSSFVAAQSPADGDLYSSFIRAELSHHLGQIAAILFFLLGAMTIVELVDAHEGFRIITDRIKTTNVRTLMWLVSWVTFFLSAILDNLTTTIVMVSLVRKLIPDQDRRLFFAGMIVIAANAGGAWSPIGDVTTTMLWIGGQITSGAIMKGLFLPSVVCLLVPLLVLNTKLKGSIGETHSPAGNHQPGFASRLMLLAGIGSLVFVPVFKSVTHLPPYMGILLGLGVLWIISEIINPAADEFERRKFSVATALSRADVPSVLFFFGILLAVSALESMQTLHHFAATLDRTFGDSRIIVSLIGVLSAIVDNVPLVAASMGMYSLTEFPVDSTLWHYLAYCAGTGGSLLIIGSAAGVAAMGMERIEFIWYVKRISWLAFLGYVGGAATYLFMQI